MFANDDKWLISASDDKSVRVWDSSSGTEVKKLTFPSTPSSIELSRGGTVLSVCSGLKVSFWDVVTLEKMKEYNNPAPILSATLHPESPVFVCGGEDFKMYKYDYDDGTEIGK